MGRRDLGGATPAVPGSPSASAQTRALARRSSRASRAALRRASAGRWRVRAAHAPLQAMAAAATTRWERQQRVAASPQHRSPQQVQRRSTTAAPRGTPAASPAPAAMPVRGALVGPPLLARQRGDDDHPRPGMALGPFPSETAVRRAEMARPPVGLPCCAVVAAPKKCAPSLRRNLPGRGGGRSSLRRNLPGGAVVSEASGGRCACLRRKLPGRRPNVKPPADAARGAARLALRAACGARTRVGDFRRQSADQFRQIAQMR